MRKALVTGGAGFLGSHLVDCLLERGLEVVAVDNLFRGSMANLEAASVNPHFQFVNGDILDTGGLRAAATGCDTIFHLAAINGTKYFYEAPRLVIQVNIEGTGNVLKVAQQEGVRRVLFTSTSEVYGRTRTVPTPEDSGCVFLPPSAVRWSYALSKLVDEHLCAAYARETGCESVILRIFNAYGPRQVSSEYGQVVGMFARRLLAGEPPVIFGDGQQTRSFTYVGDIVEGIARAAEVDCTSGNVFNLGSEQEITINELADAMIEVAGATGTIQPVHADAVEDEPPRRCPSIGRARDTFGYQPQVDLASGLVRTLEWFRRQETPQPG